MDNPVEQQKLKQLEMEINLLNEINQKYQYIILQNDREIKKISNQIAIILEE